MKLNENGDFCLLYIEPADDKQSLFEMIGSQKKPVVLLLPLLPGQVRSRLFQRPEDFNDLKYVRRQTNASIIFVTSGSDQLAQLAARYGFPAYPSIDAFAETLAHGRNAEREEKEYRGVPYASRRTMTGPLSPSGLPVASIRRSLQTAPLRPAADAFSWSGAPESGPMPARSAERATPFPPTPSEPLHAPTDFAFLPSFKNGPPPPVERRPRAPVTGRLSLENGAPFARQEEAAPHPSEIPARRSAPLLHGQHPRHAEWEPGMYSTGGAQQTTLDRPQTAPAPGTVSRPLPEMPTQPPVRPPTPRGKFARRSFPLLLVILSLLVLGGAGLGSFIVISHSNTTAPVAQNIGSVMFLSTGQLNSTTSQGIDDQVQINLQNIGSPAAGNSYYAWLLGDANQPESQSIPLGKLQVVNGSASLLYRGDSEYTNLLQNTSRFLVTEESSSVTPVLPSPDTSNWRYYGAISATPDMSSTPHFSYLDHLRHLLADEPILDQMELPGGLSNWFTRNTEELIGLTSNGRDQWQSTQNPQVVQDEAIRVLSYLDGMSFLELDIPPSLANRHISLDTRLAGLGLLNVRGVNQNPPSYMDQFAFHLNGLVNAPGAPATIREQVTPISSALSNIQVWLENLRSDAKKILAMTDAQLNQPQGLSILDDMVVQASNAYTGGSDPSTGQFKPGVIWLQQHLQSLAGMAVSTYTPGSTIPEIGPSTQNPSSFVLPLLAVWKEDK